MKLFHNDQLVQGTQTLLLRGTTLNEYRNWEWRHNTPGAEQTQDIGSDPRALLDTRAPDVWRQEIWLEPTGTQAIFAMPGVMSIASSRDILHIRYWKDEESVQSVEPLREPIAYKVISRNSLDLAARGIGQGSDVEPAPARNVDVFETEARSHAEGRRARPLLW